MKSYHPLLVFVLPSLLAAQATHTVLPAGYEKLQDTYQDLSYLGINGKNRFGYNNMPVHLQNGYAMTDMKVGVQKVVSLSYRRNNYYANDMNLSWTNLAVYMSHGLAVPSAYSTTFSKNRGVGRKQVFGTNGNPSSLNWPAAAYVKNGQKVVPFSLKIPLANPYYVVKVLGKSLCIEYSIQNRVVAWKKGPFGMAFYNLILDAAGPAVGKIVDNGPYSIWCTLSTKWFQMGMLYNVAALTTDGGPLGLVYAGIPRNAFGVATLSAYGVKTRPNPYALPIFLKSAGAPHCSWNVGFDGTWTMLKADTKGRMAWPKLTIPKGLPLMTFYDQCMVLDPKANKLGLVPTTSRGFQIVKAHVPQCVTLSKHIDTTPPSKTGTLRKGNAVVVRLDL